jgi:hypothetical protein
LLFLHEADQDDSAFFTVVSLEDGTDAFEGAFIELYCLPWLDAALLRYHVQAIFDVLDNVV